MSAAIQIQGCFQQLVQHLQLQLTHSCMSSCCTTGALRFAMIPNGGWANRKPCTFEDLLLAEQRLMLPLLTHPHTARSGTCQHDQSGLSSRNGCLHDFLLPEPECPHGAVQRQLLRSQRSLDEIWHEGGLPAVPRRTEIHCPGRCWPLCCRHHEECLQRCWLLPCIQ